MKNVPARLTGLANQKCQRNGCGEDSTGLLGIELWPVVEDPRQEPVNRLLVGIHLCDEHFEEAFKTPVTEFFEPPHLNAIAKLTANATGRAVDARRSVLCKVDLDDPDFAVFQEMQRSKTVN